MKLKNTVRDTLGGGIILCVLLTAGFISAQEEERNLAQELTNPIASLYTLPLQMNFDKGFGADGDGSIYQLNAQPLIPLTLNDDWHLVSRTIVPFIYQEDVTAIGETQSGMGDLVQSFFLTPSATPDYGWIIGAGPVFQAPSATDDVLGFDSWGLGPTAVALKTKGPWTVGALANHLWSLEGGSDAFSATYFEPWVSYVLPSNTTISLSAESIYDWNEGGWNLPVNFIVDQLITIGDQPISVGAALKYWAESPEGGADDWGFRLQCTLIWPK